MAFRALLPGWLRWFRGAAKGTLYPLDSNAEETALVVGTNGKALTADSSAAGGLSWQDGARPSDVSGLAGLVASKAPLLSPRFIGTPTKDGVALATTADITGGGGVDPSAVAGLAGIVAAKADLLSPRFLGTPTKGGLPLATTSDLPTGGASVSDVSGLAGVVASHAPLLNPRFLGTPTKNGVALATTADITGVSPDSDQAILATQIFGA